MDFAPRRARRYGVHEADREAAMHDAIGVIDVTDTALGATRRTRRRGIAIIIGPLP